MRRAVALAALVAAFVFLAPLIARALDMPRGLGHPDGPVHWYDPDCCSMSDCEPVEPGAITRMKEGYYIQYQSSKGYLVRGFIPFGSPAIRASRDAREHACGTAARVLCIYLPLSI